MLVKRALFLLNAAFAMAILDLISQVYLPSFVNMLPKYLKYLKDSTFSSCFVFMSAGTYWRKCSCVCGAYRQAVFWLCGAYREEAFSYLWGYRQAVFWLCGAYSEEAFSYLWGIPTGSVLVMWGIPRGSVFVPVGIPTGSVLVYEDHTERKRSRTCGAYRQAVFWLCGA